MGQVPDDSFKLRSSRLLADNVDAPTSRDIFLIEGEQMGMMTPLERGRDKKTQSKT